MCKTASKSRTPYCYFRFFKEKYNLINRVKNKRVLSGVPLPLSLLLDHVGLCWVRFDECVVTDMGLAGARSPLL